MPPGIVVGRIAGVYGVRGWLRLQSFTEPADELLGFGPLLIGDGSAARTYEVLEKKPHGKGFIIRLSGLSDRDQALALVGKDIRVDRAVLAEPGPGTYYWADLEGLRVRSVEGAELGRVAELMATGANDVLVVEGERRRLIPFVPDQVVKTVDLDSGLIVVDWDPAF
jgi:16S rRNA processing protein RimM